MFVKQYQVAAASDCESAVMKFVETVRTEASVGEVRRRIAVFVEYDGAWKTIVIDPDDQGDIDGPILWAVNRLADAMGAEAAAFVQDGPEGAIVSVEPRAHGCGLVFRLGRGETMPEAEEDPAMPFEIMPGGAPGGWQSEDVDAYVEDAGE